jgi:hypothetical protein
MRRALRNFHSDPFTRRARVPRDPTIAMTPNDDEEGLFKLSARPLGIVPNETSQCFSGDTNNFLDMRYSGIAGA